MLNSKSETVDVLIDIFTLFAKLMQPSVPFYRPIVLPRFRVN